MLITGQLKEAAESSPSDRTLETTLASLLIAKKGVEASIETEVIANYIHEAWCAITLHYEEQVTVERRQQFIPYEQLSSEEKSKDTIWVTAIREHQKKSPAKTKIKDIEEIGIETFVYKNPNICAGAKRCK